MESLLRVASILAVGAGLLVASGLSVPARATAFPADGDDPAGAAAGMPALPGLTLDEAVDRALRGNLDLAAVRRETEAAAALRAQAGRLANPSISYDVEEARGGQRASGTALSVPIEVGGKRAARMLAADRATRVARTEVALRSVELRAAAIQLFFEVVAAQEREQLARGSVELARRAVDVAARRVQAGRVSPVEQTRAQVAESSARVELSQAQTDLDNARKRLAALFGEATARFGPVDGGLERLPQAPSEAGVASRIADAPEVARARAEVDRRDAVAALARTQRIPNVVVNAGTRTLIETGQRTASVGVALVVPIFDLNQGNIREAVVRAEQARQQLAATELRLRAEALAARQRLVGARREADLVRNEILPGAAGALDAATRGFELGKFGFLDVLDAQRTLFGARGQLVRAAADAWRAAADLERMLGAAVSHPESALRFEPAPPQATQNPETAQP